VNFDLSTIAAYGTGGAFLANWVVNGLTLAAPERPSWIAFVAAAVMSILFVGLMTVAGAPPDTVWTAQIWANVVIVGLLGAAGGAGANWTSTSANAKREKALAAKQTIEPEVKP
jgi:hypothetical protein